MTSYDNIFENNRRWLESKKAKDKDFFKKLSQGQNPDFLYIGCSDSRVTAEELMGVNAGEVFVHRNIANLINNTDLNVMSIINYTVDVYRLHKTELNEIVDEHQRYNRLIELNVEEQCLNVIKTAAVQKSFLEKGYPLVHGWVFDIYTGRLIDMKINFTEKLKGIQEIYNLADNKDLTF